MIKLFASVLLDALPDVLGRRLERGWDRAAGGVRRRRRRRRWAR